MIKKLVYRQKVHVLVEWDSQGLQHLIEITETYTVCKSLHLLPHYQVGSSHCEPTEKIKVIFIMCCIIWVGSYMLQACSLIASFPGSCVWAGPGNEASSLRAWFLVRQATSSTNYIYYPHS